LLRGQQQDKIDCINMLNEDEHVKTVKEKVQLKYLQMYNNYNNIKYVYLSIIIYNVIYNNSL